METKKIILISAVTGFITGILGSTGVYLAAEVIIKFLRLKVL